MNYTKHYSARKTPQNQPIPGKDMVANSAGGFAFAVDDWARLQRFLILGSDGGTYYIGEQKLTIENAEAVLRCIKEDGARVVSEVVVISTEGRAPKNDPALFVLAMCAGLGDDDTKKLALNALPQVARIGTHLFNFAEYVQAFRGWGRALRRAVGKWYTDKEPAKLAYQLVKYQQRNGWSHRDLLRLSHPKAPSLAHNYLFNYVTQGNSISEEFDTEVPNLIFAFEKAKTASEIETLGLIREFGLTREMIQTQHLNSPAIWGALLENMPMTAMIRNLGKMTQVGLLGDGKWDANSIVNSRLRDPLRLAKARVHPLNILLALRTYSNGRGYRGGLTWSPARDIVSALDDAFYIAFDNVHPTGKRFVLGVDVSGSMNVEIAGMPISVAEAAAAMAMVTRRTEDKVVLRGFSASGSHRWGWSSDADSDLDGFIDLGIEQGTRLAAVLQKTAAMNFGRTDCSLPMLWALENKVEADVFAIYTDSETWAGKIQPIQALQRYREKMGIDAKLIVVAMTSNGFSIADPDDGGMLDVVGFDTSVPSVMEAFISR